MTRIIVNEPTGTQLGSITEAVELCTADGRVLGCFVPAGAVAWDPADDGCPNSAEELERLRQEGGGRPLAEIWNDLCRA